MNLGEQAVALTPLCEAEFDEPIDLKTTAEAWAILINQVGLTIGEGHARETTGVPPLKPGEAPLRGAPPPPAPSFSPFAPSPASPLPAADSGPLPSPLPFAPKAPKRFSGAAGLLDHSFDPDTPVGFGSEISDDLKRIAHSPKSTGALHELPAKLRNAKPPTIETTDMLAAGMLDATMRALAAGRKGRGA
jgi:hypothetical protein